ncbi:SDR family oxidoreductase [Chromohalobacter canadensis]|uniref:SDR family NAD(P)-dependent oxidoreductase n=1 Tax=Chromohalobacter canadensis TaxID=141389 RepID=UPI0021C0FE46|nr:SDR family oxidoreductase [Chromohalobacter canadensis]MCT8469338.1 SDR family oxidoreductase [Chromohalobacter canadensis]MCT8471962.1 SDR family oxidoreductase [Chromohalobacter canadensis]MCT8499925.1 SDR family oxidoreductase [Chromohalobacter canadensis]
MSRLHGKIVLITGGASGIGLASAQRLIEEGAFVFITGRRQDVLDNAAEALGSNARGVQADVTKPEDLDRLFETIQIEKGRLDVLVANAGVGEFASLGEITEEHYDYIFDINVKGTLFTVQKALPLMKNGGSIILTGSTVGSMGTPAMSIYSASKAAVRNLVRSWAHDLRGTGIRVNVMSPGPTKTDKLMELLPSEALSEMNRTVPLERLGDPKETAGAVAFLASDDSSFMTGSEVFVDGGYAQV